MLHIHTNSADINALKWSHKYLHTFTHKLLHEQIIKLIFADDFCHPHVERLADGMKYSSIMQYLRIF